MSLASNKSLNMIDNNLTSFHVQCCVVIFYTLKKFKYNKLKNPHRF